MPISNRSLTRAGVALLLWLAALPAFALGLGQIVVRSGPGQPLQAEIPVLADPSELAQLQARLASPDTFARVGLPAPDTSLTDLQFTVATDALGRPVIRVSSLAPVTQPVLNFLIEVDWGQGRLVREYSALVAPPSTVAAAPEAVQAPVSGDNRILPAPVLPAVSASEPAAAPETAPALANDGTTAAPAAPLPAESAPVPEPSPSSAESNAAPVAAAATPAAAVARDRIAVARGDTLGALAGTLGGNHDQAMVALLRSNPDAFIGDNINRLRAGAVLRVPTADEIASIDASAARSLVREQIAAWRESQRALPQPAAAAGERAAAAAPAASTAAGSTTASKPAATVERAARLEIVPPADGRTRDSVTQSGIAAGGKGDAMLQQELQQTKEDLAARQQEVTDLQSRVSDLEKLRNQQQQLITMKDAALADAQKNLATRAAAAPPPAADSVPTWQWVAGIGVALLVAALLGWALGRRRDRDVTPRIKQRFDSADMAAALATAVPDAAPVAAAVEPPVQAAAASMPTWHAPAAGAPIAADIALAQQRLEAAQVLLDQGDEPAARVLLHEVLAGRDPAAREQAARMLRELG